MSQRTSHTHCQSLTSQRFNQSFAKECACPTQEEKLKISSPSKNKKYPFAQADRKHENQWEISLKFKNINDLQSLENQRQLVTKCINHWADSANFKGVTFNKSCSVLTGKCFGMPNASYTNRWQQAGNDTATDNMISFNKRKN